MTIVEFIQARLHEDETLAKGFNFKVSPPDGKWDNALRTDRDGRVLCYLPEGVAFKPGVVAHIGRHDPARVLADIRAKRAILAAYSDRAHLDTDEDPEPEYAVGRARGLGLAVRHMASAWSDHPDYNPHWSPP